MRTLTIQTLAVGLGLALVTVAAAPVRGQQAYSPLRGVTLAGYGTVDYRERLGSGFQHDFATSLSPILLFNASDELLFEAEFEFALEDGGTETALEYAQVNYLGFEHLQLTAGKFLMPFGVFSERLHPSWINKLPSMPLLYGHAHGGVAESSLLPVLSDVGLAARICLPAGPLNNLELVFFATQGPQEVIEDPAATDGDHAHDVSPWAPSFATIGEALAAHGIPQLAFGTTFSDNNDNKLLGARVGFVRAPGFELHVSGFHSMYDAGGYLDLVGGNVSAEWRRGTFELRGEGTVLWQEFEEGPNAFPTLVSPGYYLQAARRFGAFEPVARWSHLTDATVDGGTVVPERRQVAFGLNYWIASSVPVKAAFEWNLDDRDRVLVQWAFGF